MVTYWNTGYNLPGYMPDTEPRLACDWWEAFNTMRNTLERFADEYWEAYQDDTSGQFETAIANLHGIEPNTAVTVSAGNYVFWIQVEGK